MARKGTVTDKDYGYKALQRRLGRLGIGTGPKLSVGILGADADKPHQAEAGAEASGLTIGQIGEVHEFGLGNNPIRSWLRGFVDENNAKIVVKIRRIAINVEHGTITPEEGFNLLGLDLVGGIQKRIANGIAPPVTAATQARKGPDKTTALINSGQFRSSISYKVEAGA